MNDTSFEKSWALITGASSGIGYELAKKCAKDDYNIVLVARNKDRLDEVAQELSTGFGVQTRVLVLDLSERDSPEQIDKQTEDIQVEIVINNAGFGDHISFAESDKEKQLSMIDLNVRALTHLSKIFVSRMLRHRKGYILNVASTASFMPGPYMAVYFASKSYVRNFSEALAVELEGTGVSVTTLCPGPTKTNFSSRAHMDMPAFNAAAMSAEQVAHIGYDAMKKKRVVVVTGLVNKAQIWLTKILPSSVTRKLIARMLK